MRSAVSDIPAALPRSKTHYIGSEIKGRMGWGCWREEEEEREAMLFLVHRLTTQSHTVWFGVKKNRTEQINRLVFNSKRGLR